MPWIYTSGFNWWQNEDVFLWGKNSRLPKKNVLANVFGLVVKMESWVGGVVD